MKTPYEVLGVAPDADEKAIATAFREAAKACHPDLNPEDGAAELQFKQITAARDALKNPEWRALYRYLQFRRQHERRHWMITIASCTISALVSAGLVSLLQQQSASEPLLEGPLPVVAANWSPQSERDPPRFALAGSATEVPGRQDLAALDVAPTPVEPKADAALPVQGNDGAGPAPKGLGAENCHLRGGRRAAGPPPPASTRCALSPDRSQSRLGPTARASTVATVPARMRIPGRRLFSRIGHAAGSLPGGTRSKQRSSQAFRVAQRSRPSYAPANECWTNEGGVRWVPCGTSGGE